METASAAKQEPDLVFSVEFGSVFNWINSGVALQDGERFVAVAGREDGVAEPLDIAGGHIADVVLILDHEDCRSPAHVDVLANADPIRESSAEAPESNGFRLKCRSSRPSPTLRRARIQSVLQPVAE